MKRKSSWGSIFSGSYHHKGKNNLLKGQQLVCYNGTTKIIITHKNNTKIGIGITIE